MRVCIEKLNIVAFFMLKQEKNSFLIKLKYIRCFIKYKDKVYESHRPYLYILYLYNPSFLNNSALSVFSHGTSISVLPK